MRCIEIWQKQWNNLFRSNILWLSLPAIKSICYPRILWGCVAMCLTGAPQTGLIWPVCLLVIYSKDSMSYIFLQCLNMEIQFGCTHQTPILSVQYYFCQLFCPGFFHEQQSFLLLLYLCGPSTVMDALYISTGVCQSSSNYCCPILYHVKKKWVFRVMKTETHWIKTLKPSVVVFCFVFHQTCGVVLLDLFCFSFQGSCQISAYHLWPADGTVIRNRCLNLNLLKVHTVRRFHALRLWF